jgi:glycosyltransferase 2 family protein
MTNKAWFRLAIGTLVTVAVIWSLTHYVSGRDVQSVLRRTDRTMVCTAVLSLAVAFFLRAARWWWILRKSGVLIPFTTVLRVLVAGFAMNNVLPLRAGDVMRVVSFTREMQASKLMLLASLVLERAFDLLSLLMIGACVLQMHQGGLFLVGLKPVLSLLMATGVAVLIGILAFAKQAERLIKRLVSTFIKSERVQASVDRVVHPIFESLAGIGPAAGVQLCLLSLVIWIFEAGVYVCSAHAVKAEAAAPGPWMAMVLANLSMILPSAPGYLGTFHVSAMTGLIGYGAARADAAAFAILVHAVLWLPVTLMGALCLIGLRKPALRRPESSLPQPALSLAQGPESAD